LGSFSDMAFARSFPIDGTDSQDGGRTFSEGVHGVTTSLFVRSVIALGVLPQ